MKKVKVEQMYLFEDQLSGGGVVSPQNLLTTEKIKKPKQSTKNSSKFKVNVGGIEIYDVDDYVSPSDVAPFWTFTTTDGREIECTGNVIVEAR